MPSSSSSSSSCTPPSSSPGLTTTTTSTTATATATATLDQEDQHDEPLVLSLLLKSSSSSLSSQEQPSQESSWLFYASQHIRYVETLASKLEHTYEGALTNHLKMSGVYWSVTTMSLLCHDNMTLVNQKMNLWNSTDNDNTTTTTTTTFILDWIDSCFDASSGGYGGDTGQDGHLLYTLSALQILAMANALHRVPKPQVISFIVSLQQMDGSFVGDLSSKSTTTPHDTHDHGGEVDTRFSYCALSALSILNCLNTPSNNNNDDNDDDSTTTTTMSSSSCTTTTTTIDVAKAVSYIRACANVDGYGSCIGAESHAGQVFCCIGALSIAHALYPTNTNTTASTETDNLDTYDDDNHHLDKLAWWLSERQCDSGGLNGRSEKQADVCYSWWILSAMSILGIVDYIDSSKLASFILKAQDSVDGGIADRPDDMPDVFHTFFGISGLSLLGYLPDSKFGQIDPVYALPVSVVKRLGLKAQVLIRKGQTVDKRLKGYQVVERQV